MWHIKHGPHWPLPGPARWDWQCASSAYGLIYGYAWTRSQAQRRLRAAEWELYHPPSGPPETQEATT